MIRVPLQGDPEPAPLRVDDAGYAVLRRYSELALRAFKRAQRGRPKMDGPGYTYPVMVQDEQWIQNCMSDTATRLRDGKITYEEIRYVCEPEDAEVPKIPGIPKDEKGIMVSALREILLDPNRAADLAESALVRVGLMPMYHKDRGL